MFICISIQKLGNKEEEEDEEDEEPVGRSVMILDNSVGFLETPSATMFCP